MSDPNLSAIDAAVGAVTETAPAKVNLTLHVTGQRADGYHLLDSLVVFVDVADQVTVAHSDAMALTVTGPRSAGVPTDARNLVWKAAEASGPDPAAITLDKHLPAAAGIGGGSSDAAACLRALARLRDVPMPSGAPVLALGADVPVCMAPVPQRMSGIGEVLAPVVGVPPLWLVLVNPGVEVPTPAVFRTLSERSNPPMPACLPEWADAAAFSAWLATQRNDLEPPACGLEPVITEVLDLLSHQVGCALARMSGSGATCFGMFADEQDARDAERAVQDARATWWVSAGRVLQG